MSKLSEVFKFDTEAKNPMWALCDSTFSLVAQLELVLGHVEDTSTGDKHHVLEGSVVGALELAKMCRELASGINTPVEMLNPDMKDYRDWADTLRENSQSNQCAPAKFEEKHKALAGGDA
jgi:hypothetical protein